MADIVNGKRLNMEIDFSANTQKARREIAELQKQLEQAVKVASKTSVNEGLGITKEIQNASTAAATLQAHLEKAININTGKLDLGLLNKSFKDAGVNLEHYQKQLSQLGPAGNQAFNSLAQAILKADVPLKQTSNLLNQFATTLKNTARWQISSSILHGFMGSLQSAFGYAKNLNESLNNIRIVTGQSTDQMAKFATEANKAAQSLSTTTTAYTDASLIYYQQGLSDEEVKRRTETTIKMANVSRQSAEEVSDQMTSVWNNFNKAGDQSTEHFADIMTALGAKTASSSSEIAEGLSKFAGIADTVGLSFDYAASALATITATSRESADVVGTSLKTIFSRLEGLKLGETLEDGTQLNKYSEALNKIGVNIFNANNELKDMDTILEETGKKWQDLTQDQKMATAQTVAGVRQYNQFITLMDNWNFMQENLETSKDAEGTLQEQADIYAESWEAAEKRVRAAFEEIYSKILDDDFFIDLNNAFAGFLGTISDTIDALGGLKGVLSGIGVLITKIYGQEIAQTIDRFIYNFQDQSKIADSMKMQALSVFKGADLETQEIYSSLLGPQQAFMQNAEKLNDLEKMTVKILLEQQQAEVQNTLTLKQEIDLQKKNIEILKNKIGKQAGSQGGTSQRNQANAYLAQYQQIYDLSQKTQSKMEQAFDLFDAGKYNEVRSLFDPKDFQILQNALSEEEGSFKRLQLIWGETKDDLKLGLSEISNIFINETWTTKIINDLRELGVSDEILDSLVQDFNNLQTSTENFDSSLNHLKNSGKAAEESIKGLGTTVEQSLSQKIVSSTQAFMSFGMALSTITGLFDTWKGVSEGSVSGFDAIVSTMTSLGMVIPAVISGVHALTIAFGSLTAAMGPISLIAAGIVGVGMIIAALASNTSKAAKAAQEAADAAEGLKTQLEDTKKANEDLKKSLSDYTEARKALDDMIVGTQEWKDAVSNVNDKVLELINNYPELVNYIKEVNGILELSDQGQEELLAIQKKRIQDSQKYYLGGQINAEQSKENAFISDNLYREMDKVVDAYKIHGDIVLASEENLQEIANVSEDSAKSIMEDMDEVRASIQESIVSREQSNLNTEQLISEIVKNNSGNLNQDSFSKFASVSFQSLLKEAMEANAESGSVTDKEAQEWYREQMGYKSVRNLDDDKGEYTKADGTTVTIDDSIAREAKATEAALQGFNNEIENIKNKFLIATQAAKNLADGSENLSNKLILFFKNSLNFDELTEKEAQELKKIGDDFRDEEGNLNFDNINEDQQKLIESLGFDLSKSDDIHAISEIVGQLQKLPEQIDFSKFAKDLNIKIQEAYNKIIGGNSELTGAGAKAIAEILQKAFYADDGGQKIVNSFTELFEQVDKNGKAKEFGNILSDLNKNWDVVDIDTFRKTLLDAGISVNYTDQQFQDLINSLQSSADAAEDFAIKYKDVHEVIDNLSDGDIISNEDYQKLGDEASKYFTTMLDGTHKLTGDAKELYDAVQNGLIKQATDNLTSLKEQNDTLYRVKNYRDNPKQKIGNEIVDYSFDTLSQSQYGTSDDVNKYYASLDIIKAFGDQTEENKRKIKDFEEALNNVDTEHPFKPEQAKALAEEVAKCKDSYNNLDDAINSSNAAMREQYLAIAMTARSFKELDQLYADHKITLDAYNQATMNMYESERMEDLDTDEIRNYAEHLQELAGSTEKIKIGTEELSSELEDNADAAEDVSTQIYRMNKAVKDLADNWEEWSSILRESSKGSEEYYKAATGVKKALADLFDISEEYISLDLVNTFANDAEAMELMKKAAKGNGKAIDELREKVTDDIVAHLRIEDNIDTEAFDETYKQVEKLLDKKINIDIGATLDDTELISALRHMVEEAGMTQGQVNQLLGAIGFTANFASDDETVEAQIPVTTTHHTITNRRPVYGGYDDKGNALNIPIGETWDETEEVSTIYHSEKTTLPVWALATAPPGTKATPKINSITKKAGGSANNFSTSNKGGKPASGGSKGGGGKKGGKGNSKKSETPKESDFDPYWQINQTILKTNEALEKLGEQEDYVFGNQRIKNLEKQNALLKVQTANYRALYKMQKQERAKLQGLNKKDKGVKINAKGYVVDKKGHRAGASKNYGARFDQDGYLANYQKITQEQLKKYNAAIKKFNKSAQSDKDQKALDRAEKDYESFKKWLDRYKELTQDEMQKAREENRQATRQQIENNMEKWNLEIQVGIDTRKAKRDWELFVNKMSRVLVDTTSAFNVNQVGEIKDDYRIAKDYTKDFNDKYKQAQELQGIVDNWDTYKANTNEGDRVAQTKSEAKKLLNEAKEELIEIGDNLAQTLGDAWGQYTDLLNSTQEQFDLVNKRLERQGDILEYNRQLLELQYGDKAFKQMKKYHEVNLKYLQQQGSNYKNEKAIWEGQFDDAVQAAIERGKQVDVHNMTTWTDDMKTIYNSMTEAAANYEQIQLKIIEEFKNQYMDEIKKATDAFETFITNGTSFEEMQTEWERRKADADHYLDTTERTYHIQSLMNKIDQSIQTNKNIKAVQKLNQLRKDELNLLSAKEKLTKYDLDAANARYEIALKEIALEESKNNKNTMKLTRNEQGNWSYQYVANTDDILKKEQELSDANYNYYELAKNHWTEAAEELMKLQQSYAEEYERISELMITEPEKAKRELEALNLWYSQENKRLVSEIETYKNDMSSTATNQLKIEYETDFETFSQINADKKKLINDLKETGIQDFHALFTSFSGYGEEAKNALVKHLGNGDESAMTQINKALNGIKSKANTIFFEGTDSVSGLANSTAASIVQKWVTDPNSIQNAISNMYSTILDKAKEYKTNTETYFKNIDDNINQVNTDLQNQENEYKTVETAASTNLPEVRNYFNEIYLLLKDQVIPKVKKFKGSLNKIPKHKTTVIEVVTKYKTIGSPNSVNSKGGGSSGGGGSSSGGSSSGTGGNKKESKGKASSHGYKIGISGSSVVILDKNNHSVKTLGTQTPTYTPGSKAAKKDANKWAKKEGYSGFATGGYTGSWDGNDGKLAVLHQKELVLNADDTKNMLDAVDTIRDVTSLNSSITDSIAKSISGMIAGTTQHILNGGNMTQDIGKNEQYVIENINAEFPNAENVEEIREAIMSLPRLASQYVSRNLK